MIILDAPVAGFNTPAAYAAITDFLTAIANCEENNWSNLTNQLHTRFPTIEFSSLKEELNSISASIQKTDDPRLIEIFKRAVANHNAQAEVKADPVRSFYKHYMPPAFLIPNINLTLDVQEKHVVVTTQLEITRSGTDVSLILNGTDHDVQEVSLNGEILPRSAYRITPKEFILLNAPDSPTFLLEIKSHINPFNNESKEGLYACGNWLTTQCESEGARRIFFTADRPDVLSKYTTTIIADKTKYPCRLSNGNLVSEVDDTNGRTTIVWQDPFPKPSYLFACVLGDFAVLTDTFFTKSGNPVELQVYLEKGKESRGEYSLKALREAMEFDEEYFDREYDLNCLKMIGIPEFNMGAMENKGMMIFNDTCLLVDPTSGTDSNFRWVSHVIAHEYFHNWSGNRVTVRNWFELALKEAFTDFRAMLFTETQFGKDMIRPSDVRSLREKQFPEETSEEGHPLMVESFVDPRSLYTSTTYTKGREVFRAMSVVLDTYVADGFRKTQNLYFSQNDGKAVTFRALLDAGNEVLAPTGNNLSQFERWFSQQGTPVISVKMEYDSGTSTVRLWVSQSCPNPKTGALQDPFQIPFSYELLDTSGNPLVKKINIILTKETEEIVLEGVSKQPIPIFLHDFCAPVILKYGYTLQELACIVNNGKDAFTAWEAGQLYSKMALEEAMKRLDKNPQLSEADDKIFADLLHLYPKALANKDIPLVAKAQLLQIPSLRALSQHLNCYDFPKLAKVRKQFIQQMANMCWSQLIELLHSLPKFDKYEPTPEQIQVRQLHHAINGLLVKADPTHTGTVFSEFVCATNFNDYLNSFSILIANDDPCKQVAIESFYQKWNKDIAVFDNWLSEQAGSPTCTVEDLIRMETQTPGYEAKNPNHIRATTRTFIANLAQYHDAEGKGYKYVVDRILEVGAFNSTVAYGYIATEAFVDFDKVPKQQRVLMAKEVERLLCDTAPEEIRDLAKRLLKKHEELSAQ